MSGMAIFANYYRCLILLRLDPSYTRSRRLCASAPIERPEIMKWIARNAMVVVSAFLWSAACSLAAGQSSSRNPAVTWPTKGWPQGTPASVGLDDEVLKVFDADLASGKYKLMDSIRIFRCGTEVFARNYAHDYGHIYAKEAKTKGPLNARLTGPYNYFDPEWHPFYHGTDLHTMQSITKTVTSIVYGAAITRGDFKAGLETPILKYFDVRKVKNVDDRKRHIALEDLLTMSSGLKWKDLDLPANSPEHDFGHMEATDDWVQFVIDRPMVAEPGKVFEYSSGDAELLAYIFRKETGQDIDSYAEKYLFAPLGIKHYWKRDYVGTLDTEGGLYLNDEDLAKLGFLYLNNGVWEGTQIVSANWVKQSVAPHAPSPWTVAHSVPPYSVGGERVYYGFTWWLYPLSGKYAWMAFGTGGQSLMVLPQQNLIVVFTGWELHEEPDDEVLLNRLLPALKAAECEQLHQ
jgi:CubicO group peptidase (beta-lactamase class C family)